MKSSALKPVSSPVEDFPSDQFRTRTGQERPRSANPVAPTTRPRTLTVSDKGKECAIFGGAWQEPTSGTKDGMARGAVCLLVSWSLGISVLSLGLPCVLADRCQAVRLTGRDRPRAHSAELCICLLRRFQAIPESCELIRPLLILLNGCVASYGRFTRLVSRRHYLGSSCDAT